MHLDRLDADRENFCDLSVRTPFGDELDHGLLASGQRSLTRFLKQKALKQRLRYLAGEEGLVISQCLNRGDQKAAGVGFEEKSARTGLEHVPDEGIRVVHREDQDLDSRKPGADLPRRLNAVERRQAKIENGDVRAGSERKLDGLFAVGSFRDDLPTPCDCRIARNPARTTSWSSAIRIRVIGVPRAEAGGPRSGGTMLDLFSEIPPAETPGNRGCKPWKRSPATLNVRPRPASRQALSTLLSTLSRCAPGWKRTSQAAEDFRCRAGTRLLLTPLRRCEDLLCAST